jgi:uncharacterized membrane protein YcaP (DUF421 family)
MFTVVTMSAVSVAACLVTVSRVVGWKRILAHSTKVDVAFTLGLAALMGGTLTGNLVAIMGGLFMACTLTALNYVLGFTKPEDHCVDDEHDAHGVWMYNKAPYV